MRTVPSFDLFYGQYGQEDAAWIETIEGLGNAADRMLQLANEKPGPYFLFHAPSHQLLGSVDTTPKAKSKWEVA